MFQKKTAKYLILIILLLSSYTIQLKISDKYQINAEHNLIKTAYILNSSLVILFFLFVDFFKNKYKDQIGFAFMTSSLLKFALFFIFIYPTYKKDGILTKAEIITFFIPYTICLIYESLIVSKILNNLKF